MRYEGSRDCRGAAAEAGSPIVDEALLQIAAIYKIGSEIRGLSPAQRRAVRQEKSRYDIVGFCVLDSLVSSMANILKGG